MTKIFPLILQTYSTDLTYILSTYRDLSKIEEGFGEKLGIVTSYLSLAFVCIIISFSYGWELTLISIISIPINVASVAIIGKIQTGISFKESAIYAFVSGMAEEVISAIRTVVVFGGQEKEAKRYQNALQPVEVLATKRGMITAIGTGIFWFISYASYSLTFW